MARRTKVGNFGWPEHCGHVNLAMLRKVVFEMRSEQHWLHDNGITQCCKNDFKTILMPKRRV